MAKKRNAKPFSRSRRLAFPAFDRKGIPLREVIAVHEQFSVPGTLAENLGDGFLYRFNPVFKNVRNETLRRGFSFSSAGHEAYYSFPLMSLDDAIVAKEIPFLPNAPWLRKLEASAPGKLTLTELKRMELKFNYLFHESAHCLAHSVFFGEKAPSRLEPNASTLLRILLGEAFANTVECVASAFPEGEIGSYFLDANCHFRSTVQDAISLHLLTKKHGFAATVRVLIATFLYANFLYRGLGPKEKALVAKFAGVPRAADAVGVMRIGLELDDVFRTTTTHFHLMKLGFPENLGKLMGYDPVARLLSPREKALRAQVNELVEVASRKVELE